VRGEELCDKFLFFGRGRCHDGHQSYHTEGTECQNLFIFSNEVPESESVVNVF